jgi:HK97 gp10 family phage protein
MNTSMRIEGADQLAKILADLPKRVGGSVMRQALAEGAEPMRSAMAQQAPRSDEAPHVGDHVVIGSARMKQQTASLAVGPSQDFEPRANVYPTVLEHGNARQAAQPFMRPAFDRFAPSSARAIVGALWRKLIERGFGSVRGSSGGAGL